MQGVGPYCYLSAQPDSFMEISQRTSWQYCRTYGLDAPTSSTIAGMRRAAGDRQPATATPRCTASYSIMCSSCGPMDRNDGGRSNGNNILNIGQIFDPHFMTPENVWLFQGKGRQIPDVYDLHGLLLIPSYCRPC